MRTALNGAKAHFALTNAHRASLFFVTWSRLTQGIVLPSLRFTPRPTMRKVQCSYRVLLKSTCAFLCFF